MDVITHWKVKKMSPQLIVVDMDRSIEFYTKNLGFETEFRYQDFYVGISRDGFSIHLKKGHPLLEVREYKKRNEHIDISFSVDQIEYLYEDVLSKSVEVIQPLRQMPYGKEFYVVDPDAYIIAFLEEA